MSIYGTETPLDRAYDYYVRVQIGGIECYSVGCETRDEAESLRPILDSAEGMQETGVVEA